MSTKIQKWGNSLAVRIPKEVAGRLKLRSGSSVDIELDKTSIRIKPTHRAVTISELISEITPKNRHDAADWGEAQGNEVW